MIKQILMLFLFNFTLATAQEPVNTWKLHITAPNTKNMRFLLLAEGKPKLADLYRDFGGKENVEDLFDAKALANIAEGRHLKGVPVWMKKENRFYRDWLKGDQNSNLVKSLKEFEKLKRTQQLIKNKEISPKNCLAHSLSLSLDQNLMVKYADEFIKKLECQYVNVAPSKAIMGKTIITFGFNHSALYLGEDSTGEVWILSKNGDVAKPMIMKLSDIDDDSDEFFYGEPRDFTLDNLKADQYLKKNPKGKLGSGYYNPVPSKLCP